MTRSANEVATLAAKAARGAGAPPAQAARFGAATACHLAAGRDPSCLERALKALPQGPILAFPQALRTVSEADDGPKTSGSIQPSGYDALLISYLQSHPFQITFEQSHDAFHVEIDHDTPNTPQRPTRIALAPGLRETLHQQAAKTLVPETAASRLSGAGAGLTDND